MSTTSGPPSWSSMPKTQTAARRVRGLRAGGWEKFRPQVSGRRMAMCGGPSRGPGAVPDRSPRSRTVRRSRRWQDRTFRGSTRWDRTRPGEDRPREGRAPGLGAGPGLDAQHHQVPMTIATVKPLDVAAVANKPRKRPWGGGEDSDHRRHHRQLAPGRQRGRPVGAVRRHRQLAVVEAAAVDETGGQGVGDGGSKRTGSRPGDGAQVRGTPPGRPGSRRGWRRGRRRRRPPVRAAG